MFLFLRLKDMSGSFQKKLQYTELYTLSKYCALIKGTKCGSRLCSTWFSQSSIEILNVKHLVFKIIGNKLLTLLLFYCTSSSSNIWLIPPLSWTSLKLALHGVPPPSIRNRTRVKFWVKYCQTFVMILYVGRGCVIFKTFI